MGVGVGRVGDGGGGRTCWALMDPTGANPFSWLGGGGRAWEEALSLLPSPHLPPFGFSSPESPAYLLSAHSLPASPLFRPPCCSALFPFPLCFSPPLVPMVALLSPPPAFSLFKSIQSQRSRRENAALGTAGRKALV